MTIWDERDSGRIDRFAIRPGANVQDRIADGLEEFAFLLLLESPLAAESHWVFYEVEYALSHAMGIAIVRWPGKVPELPGTSGLPRVQLEAADLIDDGGYEVLTPAALARVVAEVEQAHAAGLVRRRRSLVSSVADAARAAGRPVVGLVGWRLLVGDEPSGREVVGVATRLPTADDLFGVDRAAETILGAGRKGVVVHAARRLTDERRDLLTWATGERSLALVPENGIGGYW